MSKYYSSSIAFGAEQTKTEKVVVSPTKVGDVTTDAVSGALTVDEVPTLDSLNPVSSDGVARAVIQAGAELPTRGSSDTGKVLTVKNSEGDLEWDEPADGIPDMDGQAGKLLGAVDNGGTMEAQWVNAPESYPNVSGNAGKVLKVNAGATGVEWANESTVTVDQTYNSSSANAQSGVAVAQAIASIPSSSYTAGDGIDIDNDEISIDNTVALKTDIPSKGSLMVKRGTTQKELYDAWVAGWTIQSNHGDDINVYELAKFDYEFGEYVATFNRVYFGETLVYEETFTIDGIASSTSAVSFGTETTKTSNRVPAAYSQTVGKVLTIKSVPYEDPIASWESPSTVTVDQTYNASSTNAQSGTAVAGAISGVNQVPASTTSDENKVLTVNAQGAPEWADTQLPVEKSLVAGSNITITEGTNDVTIAATDTTYTFSTGLTESSGTVTVSNPLPASTSADEDKVLTVNAQGAAEWATAQSGPTYTAGVGIDITAGVVSADIDDVTIKQATTQSTLQSVYDIEQSPSGGYGVIRLDDKVTSKFTMDPDVRPQMITIHIPGNTFRRLGSGDVTSSMNVYPEIGDATREFGTESHASLYPTPLETVYNSTDGYTYIAEQDVVVSCFMGYWVNRNSMDPARGGTYYFGFAESQTPRVSNQLYVTANGSDSIVSPVVMSETVTSNQIAVAVPVPAATSADEDKVLTVDANGEPVWAMPSLGSVQNIQQVNALPANPDANTLYLIPEA